MHTDRLRSVASGPLGARQHAYGMSMHEGWASRRPLGMHKAWTLRMSWAARRALGMLVAWSVRGMRAPERAGHGHALRFRAAAAHLGRAGPCAARFARRRRVGNALPCAARCHGYRGSRLRSRARGGQACGPRPRRRRVLRQPVGRHTCEQRKSGLRVDGRKPRGAQAQSDRGHSDYIATTGVRTHSV